MVSSRFAGQIMASNYKLRVAISESLIRKVTVPGKPESIDELRKNIEKHLELDLTGYLLQYEDPDFDNKPTNLDDITDLPDVKATIILVKNIDASSSSQKPQVSLQPPLSEIPSNLRRTDQWPTPFILPSFDFDIRALLENGNREGTVIVLKKGEKGDLLKTLTNEIYHYTAYPDEAQFVSVAKTLVEAYPCLKEPATINGYEGWLNSLKFAMANLRTKLRKNGVAEAMANGGRRSHASPSLPHSKPLKRPKRSEVNYLPDLPVGEDEASLTIHKEALKHLWSKRTKDRTLIKAKMALSFALRRREIVLQPTMVQSIKESWPALFDLTEVCILKFRSNLKVEWV